MVYYKILVCLSPLVPFAVVRVVALTIDQVRSTNEDLGNGK